MMQGTMMATRVCSVVVMVLCTCVASQGMDRVVQIDQGLVRGYKSEKGDFYAFNGIPYATAPAGRNKFKAALPPPTWTETFEANNDFILCQQPFFVRGYNCLVVNVFVPASQQELLPVLFYIHGGGFTQGYGGMVSPELLGEHNVIIVTFNYRLGALGFLCTGTENIPGNQAFKDQVAALRWVKRNIASFGGNPDDVTIAGFSAGAVSVEFLMLSPMANGLFHKAISESGSVLTPSSEGRDPIAFAKRFVSDNLGRQVDEISEIENYLLNAPPGELVTDLYDEYQFRTNLDMGFTFCVEQEIQGVESFMTEPPLIILESGKYNKVPYMTGITSKEGSMMLPYFDEWANDMNDNFSEFIPIGLNFKSQNEKAQVADRLKQFYFNDQPVSNANIGGFVDFATDSIFGYSFLRSARIHVRNSVPVYIYYYTYIVSEYPPHAHDDKIRGAIHCAQSFCVNKIQWLHVAINESEEDLLMRARLTKMWSDFAKHGVPVLETSELLPVLWNPMDAERMNYLEMNVELTARDHLLRDRFLLWDDIYEQYYGKSSASLTSSYAALLCIVSIILTIV